MSEREKCGWNIKQEEGKDIKVKEFSSFCINVGNNKKTAVYGNKAHI